jgi:hypothetical protein
VAQGLLSRLLCPRDGHRRQFDTFHVLTGALPLLRRHPPQR